MSYKYKTSEAIGNYIENKIIDAFGCGCLVGIILGAVVTVLVGLLCWWIW